MRVYLCGPIAGCSDLEATGWRQAAKALRPEIDWVDPMDYMDARKLIITGQVADYIVNSDKRHILSCDKVLRNASRPTEGSAQETMFAWEKGIPLVAYAAAHLNVSLSPWVVAHAQSVHTSLLSAVRAL